MSEPKRKRGRPTKPASERLSESITTQFTEPDHDALCVIAAKKKKHVRVLVREAVLKLIRDESGSILTR